jgi:hypothetical protein
VKLKFLVSVEAKPSSSLHFGLPTEKAGAKVGYYQTLGITARNQEELIALIKDFLYKDLQSTLVSIDHMWVPDFEGADKDIRELSRNMDEVGIWYSSGHAFFTQGREKEP